jgi:hypothetical protein
VKQTLLSGASNFASLFGRPTSAARAEESDEDKKKREEEEAKKAEGEPVQGDDESDEDFEKRKKAAAEDKKTDDESDDEHKARVAANQARRAKRAQAEEDGEEDEEGDDESDGDDMKKKGTAAARRRERARCAAIFGHKAVAKNPGLAFQLAFGTDLGRNAAIDLLRAGSAQMQAAPRRTTLDERMASVKVPAVGAGAPAQAVAGTPEATAAAIVRAAAKARGEAA